MASLIEIIILGILQGLTEWLPVSSSGHLVLIQEFFQVRQPLIFDVMLHVGTLIVILIIFKEDYVRICKAVAKGDFKKEDGKLALYIAIGSVPIAVVGFAFYDTIKILFQNPTVVSIALLFTGFILFISEYRESNEKLGYIDSLFIGLAQAASLIPGVSRSGTTISTGLLCGVEKEKVFKYSFLLATPAILGATFYEAKNAIIQDIDWSAVFIGTLVSMIIGYIALKILLKIIIKRKFHYFAYYCWALGLIVIIMVL